MAEISSVERITELLSRPSLTPEQTREIIPLSRNGIYDAIKRGDIEVIRMGRRIVVPTAPLRRKLGMATA
ncbi:MAG TPA: hypothetical protein VD863_20970 [Bradyrhizobium sp.]|nr:hypothetical protein [Bradyrhizobium sp.]